MQSFSFYFMRITHVAKIRYAAKYVRSFTIGVHVLLQYVQVSSTLAGMK